MYFYFDVKKCSSFLWCIISLMLRNVAVTCDVQLWLQCVCCLGGVWCTENVNLSQSVFFGGQCYHCSDVLICGGFLRCTCGFCFRFWAVSGVQEAGLHPEALHQPELWQGDGTDGGRQHPQTYLETRGSWLRRHLLTRSRFMLYIFGFFHDGPIFFSQSNPHLY